MTLAPKEALHRIIDALSDDQAALLLTAVNDSDPVAVSLTLAPVDDEPLMPDEEAALAEGLADVAAGRTIRDEDLSL
jgi:hypothetical protein